MKEKKMQQVNENLLIFRIKELIETARANISQHINLTMCTSYFLIGHYIVEDEQEGKSRAGYAEEKLKFLGKELSRIFGRGFSARNLANMKKFYLVYRVRLINGKLQAVSAKSLDNLKPLNLQTVSAEFSKPFVLSWSHYLLLCRIINEDERSFYEIESR